MHPGVGTVPRHTLHFPEADLTVDPRQSLAHHAPTVLARPRVGGPFSAVPGTHPEAGLAVAVSLAELRELAARFFRIEIFRFDGERFFIEPVLAPGLALALPVRAASV